ncbi:hypothetical protein [Pseudonocardia sp. TRM90224]|uniref:hypothetical protein n=1 Tax=Pseudonocardia sp. TRM90224 TaxID=2812678 RepID=UPI001E577347|nr:hypothetical protein [Pseudonocardia sp. TRM90224]
MGRVSRRTGRPAPLVVAVLGAGVLVAACGGSVADTDRPAGQQRNQPPPTPFCAAAAANSDTLEPMIAFVNGGPAPQRLDDLVDELRRTGSEMTITSPEELRGDVQRLIDIQNLQLDAIVAAGGDARALQSNVDLRAKVTAPEMSVARQRVSGYVTANCGIGARPTR